MRDLNDGPPGDNTVHGFWQDVLCRSLYVRRIGLHISFLRLINYLAYENVCLDLCKGQMNMTRCLIVE